MENGRIQVADQNADYPSRVNTYTFTARLSLRFPGNSTPILAIAATSTVLEIRGHYDRLGEQMFGTSNKEFAAG